MCASPLARSFCPGNVTSPPRGARDWTLEISGRLLSLAEDVEQESADFCHPSRTFAGVIYQVVEKLRRFDKIENCQTDVIYTPTDPPNEHNAHADVVAYGLQQDQKKIMRDWLQENVELVTPGNFSEIEKLRPRNWGQC